MALDPFLYGTLTSVLLTFTFHSGLGEFFSSMATMESLPGTEREMLDVLRIYRDREVEKINAAREYVHGLRSNFAEQSRTSLVVAKGVMTYPNRAVPFISRHMAKWKTFSQADADGKGREYAVQELTLLRTSEKFPGEDDVQGAAVALARLQTTYKITAREMAFGQIRNLRATPGFTANDAFLVGYHLTHTEDYGPAVQWLKIAAEIYDMEEEKTADYVAILDWLAMAGFAYDGNVSKSLDMMYEIQEYDPTYENLDERLKHYTDLLANMTHDERVKMASPEEPYRDEFENDTYEALCRGEYQLAPRVLPHLRCYYETHNNPFLLLRPLKFEVVHTDPDVYMIHDVITNATMEQIKKVTVNELIRATVVYRDDVSTANATTSDTRVSKAGFFSDLLDPAIHIASVLSGFAANLDPYLAEELQVNNYGMGGHYMPHYDFFGDLVTPEDILLGGRIATFMYYFSDVEAGGATVFPALNVTLFPKKGAAAFWYNLYKDGEVDARMEHAGCPVLAGNKWVVNKWFRAVGQDLTRPCELRKDSPDTVSENSISS